MYNMFINKRDSLLIPLQTSMKFMLVILISFQHIKHKIKNQLLGFKHLSNLIKISDEILEVKNSTSKKSAILLVLIFFIF